MFVQFSDLWFFFMDFTRNPLAITSMLVEFDIFENSLVSMLGFCIDFALRLSYWPK